MIKDHVEKLSHEITRKKRYNPSRGTTNEIYCEACSCFLFQTRTEPSFVAKGEGGVRGILPISEHM